MKTRDKVAQAIAERHPNVPGQLAVDVPAGEDKPPKVCEYGNPRCGVVPVRFYANGHFCDDHPAGRPAPRRTAP
ncbi:MAG: aromatic ring-opening dioxygenase LigA [Streptomyces sp.]|nr:aromatic ring-opening dioxygenase LigA [Streptomyces sp.]